MSDEQDKQKIERERVSAARFLGVYFLVGGIMLFYVGQRQVFAGTPIPVWWLGVFVEAIGAAMILFPRAKWVQNSIDRLKNS